MKLIQERRVIGGRFVQLPSLPLIAALCSGCGGSEEMTSAPPPNVFLIVVDSLRADHLSAYGYTRKTSPFLDEFAQRGTRFAQAYTHSSQTKLSVASILTGLTPPSHGLRSADIDDEQRSNRLSDAAHTLAETFQAAGYATAGFVTNPHLKGSQGFSQGFDEYQEPRAKMPAKALNRKALSWLEGTESPFFLYLHYMDVHFPYRPPGSYRTLYSEKRSDLTPVRLNGPGHFDRETIEYSKALYDAQINYWDDSFRRLVKVMGGAGWLDNTVVVVVSDHGEEFGEHAGFGHGYTTYSETLHVPLIVVYEREVPKGVVRQDLVRLADIAPTIRNLAGLDPKMPITEGADLFSNEYAVAAERAVYSETYRGREPRSVRTSKHQLIYNADDSSWEFYRLEADPQGLHNRYGDAVAEDRVVIKELAAELLEHATPKTYAVEGESIELDDEMIEQLKELGYLQ